MLPAYRIQRPKLATCQPSGLQDVNYSCQKYHPRLHAYRCEPAALSNSAANWGCRLYPKPMHRKTPARPLTTASRKGPAFQLLSFHINRHRLVWNVIRLRHSISIRKSAPPSVTGRRHNRPGKNGLEEVPPTEPGLSLRAGDHYCPSKHEAIWFDDAPRQATRAGPNGASPYPHHSHTLSTP